MDEKTLKCKKCHEMNYPMTELCRSCGELLHNRFDENDNSLLIKWTYHLIDAMFWLIDETARWWEIGRIAVKMKALRRGRIALLRKYGTEENFGHVASIEEKQNLVSKVEEMERLSGREEFLRSRCWAIIPELVFFAVLMLFLYFIVVINPEKELFLGKSVNPGVFSGQVSRVKEISFSGHTVVKSVAWFNNSLYVGGDGGLSVVDINSGIATLSHDLPDEFYVRDMVVFDNSLYIAGFSGIYQLENTVFKPFYRDGLLPVKLINSLAVSSDDSILIGTVGSGLLRGNAESAVMVLGTQHGAISDFGRQGNDLWIMYEDSIYTGHSDKFKQLNLQILAGRRLRRMITNKKAVFIGTDHGIIAGYRSSRNWAWTLFSTGRPRVINDLLISGNSLFIAADEGFFRFFKGRMERLSSVPCHALAIGDSFLAAVNTDSIMLFYFSGATSGNESRNYTIVPEIGTFTPAMQTNTLTGSKFQIGRLPDFGQFDHVAAHQILTQSIVATETSESITKPYVLLPSELQRPIFTDIVRDSDRFLLATQNRGVWSYDNKIWISIDGIPQVGLQSIACNDKSCFVYGEEHGIYRINNDWSTMMVDKKETKNLLNVFVGENDELILLYRDGRTKILRHNKMEELFTVPKEFLGDFHSLWNIGDISLVVVDQGIMILEPGREWKLIFFKGSVDNIRVVSSERGPDNNLFIALNDGRVFEYGKNRLNFLGTVNDQIMAINYDRCLWISGRNSLFFLENRNFVRAPFHTSDKILGAFMQIKDDHLLVFTNTGVNHVAGRK